MQKHGIDTLVGEDTGGYATPYGNVVDIYLPNTGLMVWMPTSVLYGSSIKQVVPDHTASQTAPDLIEQKDITLDFVQNLIQENQ